MKATYWIAILALAGGLLGYAIFRATGWPVTISGIVLGILVGAVLYARETRKIK